MAKFFRRGKTKIYFVPTVASAALIPTSAEVIAGTALTASVAEVEGFSFTNEPIPVPNMESVFTATIPGEDTAEDSGLTFYEDDTTNTLFTTLAKGAAGYIVIFPTGTAGAAPAAADKAEVWPVRSTGPRREYSAGNDPARWMVSFAMTAPPNFLATLT